MFEVGEVVVHPVRGAGVIVGFEEFHREDGDSLYYKIQLLGRQSETDLMVPVDNTESCGLRRAVSRSKLDSVWGVLQGEPERLPTNHKTRYRIVGDKLRTGDILQVAEAVRDMSWRQRWAENGLTGKGKRLYRRALALLAGEISGVLDVDQTEAERQIRHRLADTPPTGTAQ
jgi:CarD family transcriptional regulator